MLQGNHITSSMGSDWLMMVICILMIWVLSGKCYPEPTRMSTATLTCISPEECWFLAKSVKSNGLDRVSALVSLTCQCMLLIVVTDGVYCTGQMLLTKFILPIQCPRVWNLIRGSNTNSFCRQRAKCSSWQCKHQYLPLEYSTNTDALHHIKPHPTVLALAQSRKDCTQDWVNNYVLFHWAIKFFRKLVHNIKDISRTFGP